MLRNVKKLSTSGGAQGIELALPKGEIWGLLGPNGSGKSALLKCIVGLVKLMRENWIDGNPRSRCTKGQIAFVPEMDTLYRWMTVGALAFTSALPGLGSERVAGLLEFWGDAGQKIRSLQRDAARLKLVLALARKAPCSSSMSPLAALIASRERSWKVSCASSRVMNRHGYLHACCG